MEKKHTKTREYIHYALGVLALVALVLGVLYGRAVADNKKLTSEREVLQSEFQTETANYEKDIRNLEDDLEDAEEELEEEKERVDDLAREVRKITGIVEDLEKLSETDEELLQKYSKVSFLNEHYMPSDLSSIRRKYLYSEDTPQQIHSKVRSFLNDMIEDAEDDDIELFVRSAYRSFGTQSILKSHYTVSYGSGANQFSADQGFSEHQLGTTVDFVTTGINGELERFGETEAYQWMLDNAHKYGFVLSYPEGNTFYIFEPWHWRFVGKDLARDLDRKNKHFYDLDQRDIDEYLLEIFD